MNSYPSLVLIRLPEEIRMEAARNYLKSGGANLLQSWPLAGLPRPQKTSSRIRSGRKSVQG